MKSVTLRTKIITGLITGGMLLSSVSLAYATSTKSINAGANAPLKTEFKQPKAERESTLKLAVSSNIITQSESDKILAYENSKTKDNTKNRTEKSDFYKELVDNNILLQTKADALKASEKVQMDAKRQENLETKLAKYVTDKTITQDQADKIKATIIKEEAASKVEREKIKTMTDAERKTYMDSNKDKHIDALKALVDDGAITQAQADKIGPRGFSGPGERGKRGMHMMQPKVELEPTLKVAVSSNIITQAESDKILAYKSTKTKDKTEKPDFYKQLVDNNILSQVKADALKASQQLQRDTKRQQNIETKLTKLVADKTITQDQSDKIKAAINKEEAASKVEMEKVKNMTDAERKIYMDSNKTTHISALKALVDDGTITQAQANKVGLGAGNHMPGLKIR